MQEAWVQSPGQEDPLEEEMAILSSFLPGKFRAQSSLEDCNPQVCKESDTTEWLSTQLSL